MVGSRWCVNFEITQVAIVLCLLMLRYPMSIVTQWAASMLFTSIVNVCCLTSPSAAPPFEVALASIASMSRLQTKLLAAVVAVSLLLSAQRVLVPSSRWHGERLLVVCSLFSWFVPVLSEAAILAVGSADSRLPAVFT